MNFGDFWYDWGPSVVSVLVLIGSICVLIATFR